MPAPSRSPHPTALALVALAGMILAGCHSPKSGAEAVAGSGLPRNVYLDSPFLSPNVKRVAALPLSVPQEEAVLESGRTALQPLLIGELIGAARFEVIQISAEQCRQWTGRPTWSSSDTLPDDFFGRLRQATGCDAVLFNQLTRYRPYPPVAIGWRMQLVQADPIRVLWAVDEIFDGGDPMVADAAGSYYKVHFATPTGADPDSILSSPRRFGQFTLTALMLSLPDR